MSNDKATALRELVKELEEFLLSGVQSGGGENDEPPDRDSVRKGGPVHGTVVAVESHYGGKLPAPVPRNAWLRLTLSRDTVTDSIQWQIVAHEMAEEIRAWAEFELSRIDEVNRRDTRQKLRKRLPDNPDVVDLCGKLDKNRRQIESGEVSEIEIARQFVHGSRKNAANLLRQARRFPHLWKGADK